MLKPIVKSGISYYFTFLVKIRMLRLHILHPAKTWMAPSLTIENILQCLYDPLKLNDNYTLPGTFELWKAKCVPFLEWRCRERYFFLLIKLLNTWNWSLVILSSCIYQNCHIYMNPYPHRHEKQRRHLLQAKC